MPDRPSRCRCPRCGHMYSYNVGRNENSELETLVTRERKCTKCKNVYSTVEITMKHFNQLKQKTTAKVIPEPNDSTETKKVETQKGGSPKNASKKTAK